MFPIQEQLLTPNKYSRPGTKMNTVKGIVIHWTANENRGADAGANVRFFENRKLGKTGFGSAHYVVDSEKILRCLPESELAYHVGATTYKTKAFGSYPNNCTIGIEMCVNADGNFKVVYEQAVQLAAMLLKKYNLNPDTALVRHFDITGKNCPAYFTSNHWGKTNNSFAVKYLGEANADNAWLKFKAVVKNAMNPAKPAKAAEKPKSHTVEKGDTFYSIAKEHGLNVSDLQKFNPRVKADSLQVGDVIYLYAVPQAAPVKPAPAPAKPAAQKPAPAKPKYPLPDGILKRGAKGTAVKQLQAALNAANFKCSVDGDFGPGTEGAMKRFQSVYCNPADGVYGPATKKALDKKVN